MEQEEEAPDSQRCRRKDGRRCRCDRRVMEGKILCEVHYLLGRGKNSSRKSDSTKKALDELQTGEDGALIDHVRCFQSDGAQRPCSDRAANEEEFGELCLLDRQQTECVEKEVSIGKETASFGQACCLKKKAISKCSNLRFGCPSEKLSRFSVDLPKEKSFAKNSSVVDEPLPDYLQCSRTDGKQWRCSRRVMDNQKLCEYHYLQIRCRTSRKYLTDTISNSVMKKKNSQKTSMDHRRISKAEGRGHNAMSMEKHCVEGRCQMSTEKSTTLRFDFDEIKEKPREISAEGDKVVLDHQRCCKTDGKRWQCSRQAMDQRRFCKKHYPGVARHSLEKKSAVFSTQLLGKKTLAPRENDVVPDHLRCCRTDGRHWRCRRRVMDNKKLCELHHLQGLHRQRKQKVPESLKIQRRRILRVSEALDEALKMMKLKKGDLQLELIKMSLQRQVERQKKHNETNCEDELVRDLPNGLMAIAPPLLPQHFQNAGPICEFKIGIDSFLMQRSFRSKNIEPLPIGPVKIFPFARNLKN